MRAHPHARYVRPRHTKNRVGYTLERSAISCFCVHSLTNHGQSAFSSPCLNRSRLNTESTYSSPRIPRPTYLERPTHLDDTYRSSIDH